MLLHYVECLDRNRWYRYEAAFASPYGAEMFAKERRLANHTVRVVDEETGAEPASGGVESERQWLLKELYAETLHFTVAVAEMGPPPGASVDYDRLLNYR